MARLKPNKNLYLDKGVKRRNQIYNWFNNVVLANNLGFFYREGILFLANGENEKAVNRFQDLVFEIINNRPVRENGDTLGYILEENIETFGKNRVILDLFDNIMLKQFKKRVRVPQKTRPIRQADIKDIVKESRVRKKEEIRFGVNPKGKREQATLRVRANGTFYLQSRKSGKFLKFSQNLREEIQKRK